MRKSEIQMSETFGLGVVLAVCGGFLDAYTYICRGHVFANAQTGNMVLFGLSLAEGRGTEALKYVIPVIAFALGVVLAELFRGCCKEKGLHWRQWVVLGEVAVLALTAFLPLGKWNGLVNVLVSFVCAMQVQTFRKMKSGAFATTMCTGNLRSGTELLVYFARQKDRALLKRGLAYYGIILFFIVGAGAGVLLTGALGQWAVLAAAALLLGAFFMMFF